MFGGGEPAMPKAAVGLAPALRRIPMEETELESHNGAFRKSSASWQRDKVAALKAHGREVREAQRELELFEDSLAMFEEHLKSLQP
jgi:hypothetical protein